jgi:hypothetical protein
MRRRFQMEILLWYQTKKESLIAKLTAELKNCDFSVSETSKNSWDHVCIGRQKIFWDVSDRIESHVCATLYFPKARPTNFPALFQFFWQVLHYDDFLVREASIDVGPAFEFPFFSIEKFRNTMPPLLIREVQDETWKESVPGEQDYWEKAQPKLHFVSFEVLKESNVIEPEVWANRIGAIVQKHSHGVIFDCGWSDWCLRNGYDFAWYKGGI